MLVSVIIPTYNCAKYVCEAIASALNQTYKSLEIILINDGSTDDTENRVHQYADSITYIKQMNQGLAAARNRGIMIARGELIAFLDSDDVWLPDKLEKQVDRLKTNRRLGVVHSDAYYLEGDTGRRTARPKPDRPSHGDCYSQLFLDGNRIVVSSVVIRRECIEEIGMFEDDLPTPPVEDYDLWLRVARYYEFAYIDEPLVLYRIHGNNMSHNRVTLRLHEIYRLQKALNANPALLDLLGRKAVNERMFEGWFQLGYLNFENGDIVEARRYFARALQTRFDLYPLLLWFVSFWPSNTVKRLRLWKQRMSVPFSFQRGN